MSKGEDTRSAIVNRALALVSKNGLSGVSIGDLAHELKMSKSGLFAHFQSKDNLEVAVLEEATRRFQQIVVLPALRSPRGEPRVRAIFENWIAWAQADFLPGGCIFQAAAVELDDRPGPARDFLAAAQGELMATLARSAQIAVLEGHFRADLDSDQFAFEWYALMMGMGFHLRMLRTPNAERRLHAAFERLLYDAGYPVRPRMQRALAPGAKGPRG